MNTVRLYTILLYITVISIGPGCKKLIEIDAPVGIIGTEQVFESKEQANSALAGIYASMMTNTGTMLFSNGGISLYAGLSADELVNYAGQAGETDYQFRTNTLIADNSVPSSTIWQPAYSIIYSANAIIEGVEASTSSKLNDSSRNILTGEARFIRAFCYFYLTNLFGDVPLALTTNFKLNSTIAKTPVANIYNQIEKDLEYAQEKLPGDYAAAGGERVRPNKWTAKALLARVYLYREKWEQAETQANDVIQSGQYNLTPEPAGVFLKNSRETIWQLKQNTTITPQNSTWDAQNFLPILRFLDYSPLLQALYLEPEYFAALAPTLIASYYLSPELSRAFEPGDKRKTIWIDTMRTPVAEPYNGAPIYHAKKYTLKKGSAAEAPQYYMVMRLAEQYLIRSEARAQQHNLTGAAADLDSLRKRALLPPVNIGSKEEMLEAIAHERQVELFTEWGHRWLDLKRTQKAAVVLGNIPEKKPWNADQLLYPIPPYEISTNPRIKQNKGY